MAKVSFGVALDFGSKLRPLHEQLRRQADVAQAAEQAGFEWVAAGEAYAAGAFHLPNSIQVLSAIALQTRMRLCTGVTLLPAWQPWKLALDTAQLDLLSGGGLALGVGIGSAGIQAQGGWNPNALGATTDETLLALRALWRGEAGFLGAHVQVAAGIPLRPARSAGPPLWVGGAVRRSARRAATHGDGYYAGVSFPFSDLPGQVQAYRAALRDSGEREEDGAVIVNRLALLAETENEAQTLADRFFGATLRGYAHGGSVEELAREVSLLGTPDQAVQQVMRYQAEGVTHLMARLSLDEMPPEVVAKSVELFGRHVIPVFAA